MSMTYGGSIDELMERVQRDVAAQLAATMTYFKDRDPKFYAILSRKDKRPPDKLTYWRLRFITSYFSLLDTAARFKEEGNMDAHAVYSLRAQQVKYLANAGGRLLDGYALLPDVILTGSATGDKQAAVAIDRDRYEKLTRTIGTEAAEILERKREEEAQAPQATQDSPQENNTEVNE